MREIATGLCFFKVVVKVKMIMQSRSPKQHHIMDLRIFFFLPLFCFFSLSFGETCETNNKFIATSLAEHALLVEAVFVSLVERLHAVTDAEGS